jgi:hypothetical protein
MCKRPSCHHRAFFSTFTPSCRGGGGGKVEEGVMDFGNSPSKSKAHPSAGDCRDSGRGVETRHTFSRHVLGRLRINGLPYKLALSSVICTSEHIQKEEPLRPLHPGPGLTEDPNLLFAEQQKSTTKPLFTMAATLTPSSCPP